MLFINNIPNEVQFALLTVGGLLAVNFVAVILHFLYCALSDGLFREAIRSVIFEVDKFADRMENGQKRSEAIRQINEVLGWRRILVPGALIGWVIDAEVAAIRKMQRVSGTPNLHEEGSQNDQH